MGPVIKDQDVFLNALKAHYSKGNQGAEDAYITYSKGDKTSVFRATFFENKPLLLHCDLDGKPLFDVALREAISKDYPFLDVSRAERYRELMQGLQVDSNYFPPQTAKISEEQAVTKLKECTIPALLAIETAHQDKLTHKPHAPAYRFFSQAKARDVEKPDQTEAPSIRKSGR